MHISLFSCAAITHDVPHSQLQAQCCIMQNQICRSSDCRCCLSCYAQLPYERSEAHWMSGRAQQAQRMHLRVRPRVALLAKLLQQVDMCPCRLVQLPG